MVSSLTSFIVLQLLMLHLPFFFFKQKTAYEMRISDWSSDVCSSDLVGAGAARGAQRHGPGRGAGRRPCGEARRRRPCGAARAAREGDRRKGAGDGLFPVPRRRWQDRAAPARRQLRRSEEHTSELQSLMRISYAVFCLKKKTTKTVQTTTHTTIAQNTP